MGDFIRYNYVEILITIAIAAILISLYYFLRTKRNRFKAAYYLNLILYKLGLKKRISSIYTTKVHIKESYEHLVDVVKHPKIIINDSTVEHPVLLRKSVAIKIYNVADKLPDGVYLKIYRAFRSKLAVYNTWNQEIERMERENPDMGRAQMLSIVNSKVSNPNASMGGHETGGAIDIALCDKNGNDMDYGTKYHEKYNTRYLTKEQKENRRYLTHLMKSQGFVKNPSQWWHFSYGDKMWAAYKGKKCGFYDSAEKEFEKMGYMRMIKTDISSANIK